MQRIKLDGPHDSRTELKFWKGLAILAVVVCALQLAAVINVYGKLKAFAHENQRLNQQLQSYETPQDQ